MNCQECNENEANVNIWINVNGYKQEMFLCQECASKLGVPMSDEDFMSMSKMFDMHFPDLLSSFFDLSVESDSAPNSQKACSECGLTLKQLKEKSRLGCANCYDVFTDEINTLLRRLHGANEHIGKIPANCSGKINIKRKILTYKNELQKAISEEKYEQAAEIRDKIVELERSMEVQ